MTEPGRTYTPQQAQSIRDAYLLASRTFNRNLTRDERANLARIILDLAATQGCDNPERLATRAIIRAL